MKTLSNRLTETTSTYLLQHVDNPVHWQPWDSQTLAFAKAEDKPILLSIGYAACHWCHVMAHECFEDDAIAQLMNDLFINIKVDRQERPDLDSQYQLTHQLFTGRGGGWPLTIFLDPQDLTPFFAGTYFPPQPSRGMPGFADLLQRLSDLFSERRTDLQDQSQRIREALQQLSETTTHDQPIDNSPLLAAHERLLNTIDDEFGGIGGAPKFPRCPELNLLHRLARQGKDDCADALQHALQAMLDGGLYDHLGGGFYRYCVDGQWIIPHFEKMLYDNAQLLPLLAAQTDQLSGSTSAIYDTIQWLGRRMALPAVNGNLYAAALDADSLDANGHSEEGAYYLWDPDQVRELIDAADYPTFANHYGLDQPANFEGEAWHLQRRPASPASTEWSAAQQRLLQHRQQRTLPTLDVQALCGWNALLAYGLLQTGYRLSDISIIDRGKQLTSTLLDSLWQPSDTPWLHQRFANHGAHGQAFLDDAANLLMAMLHSIQWNMQFEHLQTAMQLADYLLVQFYDQDNGGFWLSPPDHDDLLVRNKPFMDDATPSSNAIACQALLRLGHLVGDQRYLDAVTNTLHAAWGDINQYPGAAASMLLAVDDYLNIQPQLLAYGNFAESTKLSWLAREDVNCYFISQQPDWLNHSPSMLSEFIKQCDNTSENVMVCMGMRCLPLCSSLDEAAQVLYKETTINPI